MSAFIFVGFDCAKKTTFWWSIRRTWIIPKYMKYEKGQSCLEKALFSVLMGI